MRTCPHYANALPPRGVPRRRHWPFLKSRALPHVSIRPCVPPTTARHSLPKNFRNNLSNRRSMHSNIDTTAAGAGRASSLFDRITTRQFMLAVSIMALIVMASNVLVQYHLNRWLTWGALTYPVSFLVADLLNRRFGPHVARRVAYVGYIAA